MKQPTAYAMFRDGEYYDAIHPDEYDKTAGEYDIPLYTHPAKELHLSLQKSKETGELLAVTYTDDEHRIVEVLWQKPPAKILTNIEIEKLATSKMNQILMDLLMPDVGNVGRIDWNMGCTKQHLIDFADEILRKAQE